MAKQFLANIPKTDKIINLAENGFGSNGSDA